MAFQTTVLADLVSGTPGEIAFDVPSSVTTGIVNSTTEANNIFGRAFTYNSLTVESMQAGGTGVFAGILINPKGSAVQNVDSVLTTGDSISNNHQAEFLKEGEVYVRLANAGGAIGADVYFVNATGEIGHGTAASGQTQITGGMLVRHAASAETPNLAVVRIKA